MSVSAVRAVATRKTWWAALLVALALTGALAPRAGAVLVHVGHGHVAGVLPIRGVTPASIPGSFSRRRTATAATTPDNGTLDYGGGPVLHASTPYLIFWGPSGAINSTEKANLEQYFADTAAAASGASSNVYGVNRQFTDTTGFADYSQTWSATHAITDTNAYPAKDSQCTKNAPYAESACIMDSQIQAEVQGLVTADHLPTGTSGSAPIYFVVTPPAVNTCFPPDPVQGPQCADNVYCAYHSNFSASGTGDPVLYANMPMLLAFNDPKGCQADGNSAVQKPNSNQVTDVVTSSMSHEFSETITDPVDGTGWYDPTSGNEDGDNCAFAGSFDPANDSNPNAFLPLLGGSENLGNAYNQSINGDHYYTQTEWSNGDTTCEAKPTSSALTAAFAAPSAAAPDTVVAFDPSSSSASAEYTSTTWDFGDGTTSFTTSGPSQLTHYFRTNGTFTVTLTLVDAYGNLSTVSHNVTVSGVGAYFTYPTPPPPQTNTSITFNGSSSVDSYTSITTYTWSFDADPPVSTGNTPTVDHPFTTSGLHTVKLTVSDGTHSASWTESVRLDAPPSAAFAVMTANPVAGTPVAFDGTGSSETNGSIVSYSWNFGDGSAPDTGATPSHTYVSVGTYNVTLTVTDQDGYTAQVTHSVVIDSPPTPAFSVSAGPRAGSPVAFDGSASNEPGGSISSYRWNYGDGSAVGSGATPSHTYASPGAYTVTLTVTDAKGRTASAAQSLTVLAASAPPPPAIVGSPSASISVTTAHPIAGATTAFSGSGSSDTGSTLVAYGWTFGDGGSATGVTPGHPFAHPGTYTVTLTVRDATGVTATTSQRVTVKSAGITGVKIKKGKTIERLTVALSGPGTLTMGKLKFKLKRAGAAVVTVRLSAAQRQRVTAHHSVVIRLTLRFAPKVGKASRSAVKFSV